MSSFSVIFDVALGLILLYLVLSITASALSESISNVLQWRAQLLERFIGQLLKNSEIKVNDFYSKTLLQSQSLNRFSILGDWKITQRPAYLRADDFSQAILDTLRAAYPPRIDNIDKMSSTLSLDDWKTIIAQMKDGSSLKTLMLAMLSRTQRLMTTAPGTTNTVVSATSLHDSLNDWYNASMQRVTDWYKARIQITLLFIGIGISAALNIDTITVANSLLQNPAIRSAVEATAATVTSASDPKLVSYLNELAIPIGWNVNTLPIPTVSGVLLKIVGILITGFAVSQGAPFWFDLLNRVTNLRSSGKAPSTISSDPTLFVPPAPSPAIVPVAPSPVPTGPAPFVPTAPSPIPNDPRAVG